MMKIPVDLCRPGFYDFDLYTEYSTNSFSRRASRFFLVGCTPVML